MYDIVVWFGGVNALSVLVIVGFLTFVCTYWVVQLSAWGRSVYGWMISRAQAFRVWATNELNTSNVSHELRTVTDWYQLGTRLRIPSCELRKIELQYAGTNRRRTETVDLWLRSTPNASWRDVVTALKEIEENTLAEKIRRKYIKSTSTFDE